MTKTTQALAQAHAALSTRYPLVASVTTLYLDHIRLDNAHVSLVLNDVFDESGPSALSAAERYCATLTGEQLNHLISIAYDEFDAYAASMPAEHYRARTALADLFEMCDSQLEPFPLFPSTTRTHKRKRLLDADVLPMSSKPYYIVIAPEAAPYHAADSAFFAGFSRGLEPIFVSLTKGEDDTSDTVLRVLTYWTKEAAVAALTELQVWYTTNTAKGTAMPRGLTIAK